MNKIQFQVYPNDVNILLWKCACNLLPCWQLNTVGLCPLQIWLNKEKGLVSNVVDKLGIRERVVTFTHYTTDFSVWIHTKPADHTVQEGSHVLASWSCHPWAEVAYVGKALALRSALTVFSHLSPRFPPCRTPAEQPQPSLEEKPMAKSWWWGALGPPYGAPRCLLTWALEIWVRFLQDEAFQHWCPVISVTLDVYVLPLSSPACNKTRFLCWYCSVAEADEKLRYFSLELVAAGMVLVQQLLADAIHYYYLLHSLQ